MCVKDIALPKLEMSFTHKYHIFSEIVECGFSFIKDMMKCLYFIFIFCSWTGTFFIIITTAINVVPLLGCERNSRVQFGKAICNLCNISLYCETNYYQLHI